MTPEIIVAPRRQIGGAYNGLKFRYEAIQWCFTNFPNIRNVYCVGSSMGCLNALSFQKVYPGLIKAIVGISGVTNLTYGYNAEGFNSIINNAYATDAIAKIQDQDPNLRPELYKNIPIKLWHGVNDTLVHKVNHADTFKTNVENAGGSVEVISVVAGHIDTAALYEGEAIFNFFKAHV